MQSQRIPDSRMAAAASARRAVIAIAARRDGGRGPMYSDAPMCPFDTGREHEPGNFRGAIAFYAYTAQSEAARRRAAAQLPDLTPRVIPGTPRQA